jgi:SagB-type dehydrogenase family enzyme
VSTDTDTCPPTPAEPIVATVRLTSVTGADASVGADPTEDFHEASRMYAGVSDPEIVGTARLERSLTMRITASRSVKRFPNRPLVPLPEPALGRSTLADALGARRSRRAFVPVPLALRDLSSLLHAAYGVTGVVDGTPQALRSAPSGGALYPLELYCACRRVDGLDHALYHYDPLRRGLELLRPLDGVAGDTLTPYGAVLDDGAVVIAMTAVFWRSRFKYGPRAYRFALMEAGHVGQNLLLAAAALELAAVPVGGFYDRAVDAWLGVDGIHEASLYLVSLGHEEP